MMVNFRRLASPSFRTKVFLASFICIGIPVLVSLSLYTYLTRDAVEEQAIMNANKELNLVNENVSKILEDLMNVSNFVQIDSELNTVLKDKSKVDLSTITNQTYEEYMADQMVRKTIENITLLGEKSYVTILLTNGKYYTNYSTSEYKPTNIFEESWFDKLRGITGYKSLWIGVEPTVYSYDRLNHPFQISVARTLRDTNQSIYGYVVVSLLETKIRNILQNQNEKEHILLVDGSKSILSTENEDKIGNKLAFDAKLNDDDASQIIEWNGQKHLVTTKALTFNNWELVSIIPYKQATSNINSVFSRVFILLAVSFTLFFLILAYLMNRITKPLSDLDQVVKQVQKGDLSVRSWANSNDEIGKLSNSFNQMLERVNLMIEEIKNTQKRKRQAELAMLQAQINPHFLFNVLNSIRMKVMRFGDKDSAGMIQSLSKLLRGTIDNKNDLISIYDEVHLVVDYVQLMNMRQKNKIQFITDLDESSYSIPVPRFILQPLIENSIIHGLQQNSGKIVLKVTREKDVLEITIKDNGIGMDSEKLRKVNQSLFKPENQPKSQKGFSSIGLANVYERLHLSYKFQPEMKIYSNKKEGTMILIRIPIGGDGVVQGDVS